MKLKGKIITQGWCSDEILSQVYWLIEDFMCKTGCNRDDLIIMSGVDAYNRLKSIVTYKIKYDGISNTMKVFGVDVIKKRYLDYNELMIMEKENCWETQPRWNTGWNITWDRYIRYGLFGWDSTNTKWIQLGVGEIDKNKTEEELMLRKLKIKKVIYNEPATIVYWEDGDKTVVKALKGETFDKEKGLAMAMCKRMADNRGNYNDIFRKWCN